MSGVLIGELKRGEQFVTRITHRVGVVLEPAWRGGVEVSLERGNGVQEKQLHADVKVDRKVV